MREGFVVMIDRQLSAFPLVAHPQPLPEPTITCLLKFCQGILIKLLKIYFKDTIKILTPPLTFLNLRVMLSKHTLMWLCKSIHVPRWFYTYLIRSIYASL